MNLKTCLVTGQYPPQVGGVGHSAHRVANLLASRGLQVHVVALQKHVAPLPFDESYTSTQEGKVLVHRVKVYHPAPGAEAAASDAAPSEAEILTRYNREMFQALEHFHLRYGYDVLHAFFLYPAGFIAGLVGRMHGAQVIASIRGNDVGKYAFDPLRLPFVRLSLENADYVTSVATSLTELADRAMVPIGHKAKTILNSVDLARLRPQNKPDLPLKGKVIGSAGLFRYKKGLVYLFKALAQLQEQHDFTILLAGDFFKEEDREPHMQWLREYGLMDRTIVTGKIAPQRMADYLQLFDVLVFPSLFSEGCPLSMLEAMALKKVIIGSRAGAIPEVIRDHENGLLVRAGSSEDIARALGEVLSEAALFARLGNGAAQTAAEMTPEREFREWMAVYETVGARPHVHRER
ncbi:glycosyltransferase [candidate division KSB1 bacterium]|nr:glycosyltransferase [candidate division KSB1 bacterium]